MSSKSDSSSLDAERRGVPTGQSDEVLFFSDRRFERMHYVSPEFERITGLPRAAVYADLRRLAARLHPDDRAVFLADVGAELEPEQGIEREFRLLRPRADDGEPELRWLRIRYRLVEGDERPPVVGTLVDVTARRETEMRLRRLTGELEDRTRGLEQERERLRGSLAEKQALLDEIHHRVKNNLQIVASLLYLQGKRESPRVCSVLDECRARVHAMALIHEQLYESSALSLIDMREFLTRLAAELSLGFERPFSPVIAVDGPGLTLDIQRAIPIALIANELLTNAIKYAYPNREPGAAVLVRVHVDASGLEVSDDGIGLPTTLDPEACESVGLRLVCSLAEQVGASLSFDRSLGTRVRLLLPTAKPTQL